MKKTVMIITIILLMFTVVSCSKGTTSTPIKEENNEQIEAQEESKPETNPQNNSLKDYKIGDSFKVGIYDLAITNVEIQRVNVDGEEDAVILTLKFKNNSEKTLSFSSAINHSAFQDGIGKGWVLIDEHNLYTELRPGAEIENIKIGVYQLTSKNNIEIELFESYPTYSIDDKIVLEITYPGN